MWDRLVVFYRMRLIRELKFDYFEVRKILTGFLELFLSNVIQEF